MKVKLNYSFIFEPAETWDSKDSFNAALAKVFMDMGFQLERIRTSPKSKEDYEEMLLISKIPLPEMSVEKEKSMKQIRDRLSKKRDEEGKYIVKNG